MKILFTFLAMILLLFSLVSCDSSLNRDDIQKEEEAMDRDDLHESDSFDDSVPLDEEDLKEP